MSDAPPPLDNLTREKKNWAMIAHLSGLLCLVPFGNIVGPLLIWQIKREELGEFVGANAREALNFQFTFVVVMAFCFSLCFLPLSVSAIGLVLMPIVILLDVAMCVIATIQVSRGVIYRYPFVMRVF